MRMAIVRFVLALHPIGRKSGASLSRLLCSIVMENQLPVDTQVKSALYFVISAMYGCSNHAACMDSM